MLTDPEEDGEVSALYLWFRVGSACEPEGLHGAAHFLEHLLFKGAGHHGVGEAASRIEGLGGDLNAYTAYEQTVIHATVPAGREEPALQVIAEMALRPHLDAAEIERERQVVIEEIRGARDAADQVLADGLHARLYGAHPYGAPILGTEQSVAGLPRDGLATFHAHWYTASNAILAVSGPVDPDAVEAMAARCLGRGPAVSPRAFDGRPAVGVPAGERSFVVDQGFEERLVEVAFPLPGLHHADQPALDLLAAALGAGDASLLPSLLRDEQGLVHDAWAGLETEPDGGALIVGFSALEGQTARAVEALAQALARVAQEGVSPGLLHRARQSAWLDRLRDREVADGRAHRMAWYEAWFSDPRREAAYEGALLGTTAGEVRRAAARWLDAERAVLGAVARRRQIDAGRLKSAFYRGFEKGVRLAPRGPGGLWRGRLGSGLRLAVLPVPDAEMVGISVVGVGGALVEGARTPGLADVWASAVLRGAAHLDARAFAEAAEDAGAAFSSWAHRNSSGFAVTLPAGSLGPGLDLLASLLLRPRFEEEELLRCRTELDEAREAAADSPADLAMDLAWEALFPGHAWGRPAHGTAAGVARASRSRLLAYHRRVISAENLVIGVAGAVDPERLQDRLGRLLAGLPAGEAISPDPPAAPPAFHRERRKDVDRAQAHLVLGFPGAGWNTPEGAALALAEGVLGGQGGRLFVGLRERLGLAYDVSASSEEGLGGGAFFLRIATDPQRVGEAREALWAALDALVCAPVPEDELARVKTRLVDGAALELQRTSARAARIASAERHGPGADHWRAPLEAPGQVSAETLQAVAGQVFRRDRCVVVRVGPRA